jgi:pyruvate formate lyase activating enzyme
VYTGNVADPTGQATSCVRCGSLLIERDGYTLGRWELDGHGRCRGCQAPLAGRFDPAPGTWGARRAMVRLATPR